MGHYDCRECGEFGCRGECLDPDTIAREAERARDKYINDNTQVLENEHIRRQNLLKARKNLAEVWKYDSERYGYLFK